MTDTSERTARRRGREGALSRHCETEQYARAAPYAKQQVPVSVMMTNLFG